jgi:hypothetical protein
MICRTHRPLRLAGGLAAGLLLSQAAHAVAIFDPGQGPVVIPGLGNAELSGITRQSGSRYLAIADSGAQLFSLDVTVDAATGAVTSVASPGSTTLSPGADLEGVAWSASRGTVLVSDEVGAAIREYDPITGSGVGSVAVPAVFANARNNLSLESLTLAPDESALWTANEAALTVDGTTASPSAGTWVRLQRFDASLNADLQLAYQSEPFAGILGVVDLLALPGGGLLSLERTLGVPGFGASLFAIDASSASDVSAVADLSAGGFQPVQKQLLWSAVTGPENFEGITLGPTLAGGERSLLLVSDGGGNRPPTLLGLRIALPEPSSVALLVCGLALAARRSSGR